jgi:hypothetical protein
MFGQVGVLPTDFYRMTFAETILMLQGYNIKQSRDWEKFRLVSYQVYLSYPKREANKSITNYLSLVSDKLNKKSYSVDMLKARRQAFLDKDKLSIN